MLVIVLTVVLCNQVMTMNTLAGPATVTRGHRSAATTGHRQAVLHRLLPTIPIGVNEWAAYTFRNSWEPSNLRYACQCLLVYEGFFYLHSGTIYTVYLIIDRFRTLFFLHRLLQFICKRTCLIPSLDVVKIVRTDLILTLFYTFT